MSNKVTKEHPILFSTEMVKAILAGRKTQTRRICKVPIHDVDRLDPSYGPFTCDEYGDCHETITYSKVHVDDLLWVRETWAPIPEARPSGYFSNPELINKDFWYRASNCLPSWGGPWKPSIHMPRKACRLTLKVTNVRLERLHDISEEDAVAEGAADYLATGQAHEINLMHYARNLFCELWDSINKDRGYGWDANPWVWVYDFEVRC